MQPDQPETTLAVGSRVFIPNLLDPGHPSYASAAEIYANPGPIVSIADGWAMVDLGSWGQFGRPLSELIPAGDDDAA